jgi:hypothetical protein
MPFRALAVEGIPFTGKTTLAARLAERQAGVVLVPEYHDWREQSPLGRVTVPSSWTAERRLITGYIALEKHRWQYARSRPGDRLLFDRTLVSVVAYADAIDSRGCWGAAGWAGAAIKAAMCAPDEAIGSLDGIFYLEPDTDWAFEQHARFGGRLPRALASDDFVERLLSAYDVALTGCGVPVERLPASEPRGVLETRIMASELWSAEHDGS